MVVRASLGLISFALRLLFRCLVFPLFKQGGRFGVDLQQPLPTLVHALRLLFLMEAIIGP